MSTSSNESIQNLNEKKRVIEIKDKDTNQKKQKEDLKLKQKFKQQSVQKLKEFNEETNKNLVLLQLKDKRKRNQQ